MNDKRLTALIVLLGVIICAAILLCFMTTRKTDGMNLVEEQERTESMNLPGEQERADSVEIWARAVCNRDGQTVSRMISEEYIRSQGKEEMVPSEGEYNFGWSSPWPWDEEADFRVLKSTVDYAEILYYAWTSEPHVTAWHESLSYHVENGQFYVDGSDLKIMEAICVAEEFEKAYPDGVINGAAGMAGHQKGTASKGIIHYCFEALAKNRQFHLQNGETSGESGMDAGLRVMRHGCRTGSVPVRFETSISILLVKSDFEDESRNNSG